ncbi:MAG: hypothetical protein E7246_01615 [Lachnoclostridium sp.]|nr:hypothetical protein [Lachnoclostridium sp.]
MLKLIPAVKQLKVCEGTWNCSAVALKTEKLDKRLEIALDGISLTDGGIPLEISISNEGGEAYQVKIDERGILIKAGSEAGAFYAIQTLKQIIANGPVPYLEIEDQPDFEYRGFYHDITRGKIPTVETMKQLIDQMAYYKMNSLQLYVEHVYEFEECKELIKQTGFYSKAEMQELDEYCKERFIDFIPSLSTFGHLCELLELDEYKHLRVLKDFEISENRWHERMAHHTLDPRLPESEALVKSLIDQYVPAFTSETFNICCDETFDLQSMDSEIDAGKLYVEFSKKIIDYVKSKGKKVMMWGDVLLEYPECIEEMPEDVLYLNWDYGVDTPEEKVQKFSELGRKQIVCPGTTSWSRFCEEVATEEQNITRMIDFGYKYGALGVLNTNWGDWGNPASLEMAMYGMVLGAAKSWTADTVPGEAFYSAVNHLLYGAENAIQILKEVSAAHMQIKWLPFTRTYLEKRYKKEIPPTYIHFTFTEENLKNIQETYVTYKELLAEARWTYEEAREEMLLSLEGICMMAEFAAKMTGIAVERMTDTHDWLARYSAKWEAKNKPCELSKITEMFEYLENNNF